MTKFSLPSFTEAELRCKGTGMLRLAPGFGQALQGLRDAFGRPMTINSCCRAAEHNASVGGHPRSLHVCDEPYWPTRGTCAVDVRLVSGEHDELRDELVDIAWARGWSIGFHPRFLHLDLRSEYAGLQQARFNY